MRRALAALALAAPLLLSVPAAGQGAVDQAKTYFDAGAKAYAAGQFMAAIQAFEEAYRLSPRPGILFSMAQAHRRQYYVDKNAQHLQTAVRQYREYIEKVAQGGRRADAAQALAELEPIVGRGAAEAGSAPAPAATAQQTRVMVSSQTKGARASLDGAEAVDLEQPLIAEVKPGKHVIKVTADGYFDEVQEIQAVEGGLVPRDVPLRERPALLKIAAPNGSDVTVDGRPMGVTPLPAPLEVTAGRHFVAVTKVGNHAFSQEVDVKRGESRMIVAKLDTTGQRYAAFGFFGVGAVSAAVAVYFTASAYGKQTDAEAIEQKRQRGNISLQELQDYNDAKDQREALKGAAVTAFGAGALLGTVGLLLYVFDQPSVTVPAASPRSDDKPRPAGPPKEGVMEVSAAPSWSPGFVGGALTGRF